MVSVQCILGEGDLPVKILWEFNGKKLESENGIIVSAFGSRVSNMMIESVEGRHAGNYTCSAQNRAGTESFMAELKIIGTNRSTFYFPSHPSRKSLLEYLLSRSAMNHRVSETQYPFSVRSLVATHRSTSFGNSTTR